MRKPKNFPKTQIVKNDTIEAKSLMVKLREITNEKEPIPVDAEIPRVYTHRNEGVLPGHDIRSDKFEIAREAKEKINKYKASEWAKGNFVPEIDVPTPEDKKKTFGRNDETE